VIAAAAITALLPVLTLRGAPSRETKSAILDHSIGGSKLVGIYSKFFDGDKDTYSTFFGGADCDDGDKDVHPGATEVIDDGKDNDCRDGDLTQADVDTFVQNKDPVVKPSTEPPLAPNANVLIVMVDTVRADKLTAELTPRIDGLAHEGVHFTRGYSVASNTPRAMPAFMTSRYPSMIAVDKLQSNYPILDESNVMLFETLKDAGLATYGFSSHYYFQDKRHFSQGFDQYDNEGWLEVGPANHDISAPRIVPKVTAKLAELGASKQRFAMWVHLFDPHSTYMEHEDWPITTRGTESLKQKYDGEIHFEDGYIGQILDAVKAAGLDGNTLVVVVSDHGEAFGVHRFAGEKMFFHGQTLYDELLRIPLVIRGPGIAPDRKVDSVVQLIDVAPTILDALGIAVPPSFMGRSLVPALRGKELPPRAAYAELIPYPNWKHEARAMVSADGKWKLFDRVSDNQSELYDLAADPEERDDVFTANKDVADQMASEMAKFFAIAAAAGAKK
jgi:arylsulfatase A-like enzyme